MLSSFLFDKTNKISFAGSGAMNLSHIMMLILIMKRTSIDKVLGNKGGNDSTCNSSNCNGQISFEEP